MFRHRSMSLPDRELGCSVFGNMTGTAVDAKTVFLCEKAVSIGYLSYPESRDAESDEYSGMAPRKGPPVVRLGTVLVPGRRSIREREQRCRPRAWHSGCCGVAGQLDHTGTTML